MADPSLPTTEPSLSISSGSSSFLIRANPTLDSDVESSLSLNNSDNGADSDFELQGSDTGENEFDDIDNQQNPKDTGAVKGFDGGSVAHDSDFEENLTSNYSSTHEEEDDEEEGDYTESDDNVVEEANEVIPIRARLTRESDDDDISLESGEIDNDYGFLSAVRMPVRVSPTTAIDFEDEEEDSEFEFEIPPAAAAAVMEDVPENEIKVLSLSEQSISMKVSENEDPISFLEEIKSYTVEEKEEEEEEKAEEEEEEEEKAEEEEEEEEEKAEEEKEHLSAIEEPIVVSSIETPNIEETLISEIPASTLENPLIESIIQQPNFEEDVSVKTHCLNSIASEDPHDFEKYDEDNNGTADDEDQEEEEEMFDLTENSANMPPNDDERKKYDSEDPHDSEKYDEDNNGTADDEDQEEEEEMFDITENSANKPPNDDERKKLVRFFRFVHRLGLSPDDSLIEELLFHQLKNPNLQSAKEEAKHLDEQEADFDSSLNILVIGKTGVGKSATINSIFGQERAKTDAFQPGTRSVTAISGTINAVKLTIFDTPGFRPSPSEYSINSKILLSIKRVIRNTPPDIILYIDRFDKQTRDQEDSTLLRSISRSLGSSIWNSTMVVFTHAASTPFYGPKLVDDDQRVILVENNNNKVFNIERWRHRLLLLGYSMKLLLLSETETEHLSKHDMEFENLFTRLLEKNCIIGEDETLMMRHFVVEKMKMEVEAKLNGGKFLFRVKSTDQHQIALLCMLPIANAVFRRIFS